MQPSSKVCRECKPGARGHTPEQRDKHPLCGAKRHKNKKPCRLWAGMRTEHPGVGRCWLHGGRTETHNKDAAIVEAGRQVGELGANIDVTPAQLMKASVNLTAGALTWAMRLVSEIDDGDVDTPKGKVRSRVFAEERERAARIAKLAADLGVDERMVQLASHQTAMVASILEAVAGELEFTPAQKKELGPAVRRQIALMEASANGEVVEGTATERKPKAKAKKTKAKK